MVGDYNAHTPMLDQKCKGPNKTGKTLENIIEQERVCLINPMNFLHLLTFKNRKVIMLRLMLSVCQFTSCNKNRTL